MKKLSLIVVILVLSFSLGVGIGVVGVEFMQQPIGEPEVYVVKANESPDGYATIYKTSEPLKILTLTDPQTKYPYNNYETNFGGSNDNTFVFIERLVLATEPDLVIITGDIVMSMIANNVEPMKLYLDLFEKLEVYWAPSFGNHDSEELYVSNSNSEEPLDILQNDKEYMVNMMSEYPHCLISAGDAGVGGGVGNYFINVREQPSNDIIYTMCIMDTVSDEENNSYFRAKTPAQIEWYERHINNISNLQYGENRTADEVVKSMVFAHVPVPEIYEAYELAWNDGNPTEDYIWGHKLEGRVSDEEYASCEFFESMVALGSTTAMFGGHWHSNDFRVKYEGIDLVFAQHSGVSHYYRMDHDEDAKTLDMSDIFTYGDERGGDLITIKSSTEYEIERLLAKEVMEYDDIAVDYYGIIEDLKSRGWHISGVPEN